MAIYTKLFGFNTTTNVDPIKAAYGTAEGKVILPDIIANAGGVIVSYLEWLQNKNDERWDEKRVNKQLSSLLKKAVADMYEYARQNETDLKHATFAIAIKRFTE